MRSTESDWASLKIIFDEWFESQGYQQRMAAKNSLERVRASLRARDYASLFKNVLATLKTDPWFWLYKGCGFRYQRDSIRFLNILKNVKYI
jgi:hypothetical protein